MNERLPKIEKPELENAEKDPLELRVEQAKLMHDDDPEGAMDILEDVLDAAYRAHNMDLYNDVVDLMDKWEE